LEPLAFTKGAMNADKFLDYLLTGQVQVGIQAVFSLVDKVIDHKIRWNNEVDWDWLRLYVARMLRCNQQASYQSPRDATDHIQAWLAQNEWMTRMQRFDNMASTFKHLQYVFNSPSYKSAERRAKQSGDVPPPLPAKLLNLGRGWTTRRLGALVCLSEVTANRTMHYVLTQKDLRRCAQMCYSLADMEMYFANYAPASAGEQMYAAYRHTIRQIQVPMKKGIRLNEVARACDVAAALLLSHYATDIWSQSVIDQSAKIHKERLDQVMDVEGLCNSFRQLPLAEAVELSKVYKFLPCPDFNFLTLLDLQREKHFNTRPAFGDNELGLDLDDFKVYQRHQMLVTYQARHGQCPGSVRTGALEKVWHRHYPHVDPRQIPYREASDVEWSTHFRYEKVTGDYNPYVKDKSLAPNTLSGIANEKQLHDLPAEQRSYMLHYLECPRLATPEQVALGLSEELYERVHTVFPKPESKKPDPRNVYVNNYPGRILVSELDNNIAEYVSYKPGSFTGLGRTQSFNKFKEMAGTEMELVEYEYVHVSFDLAGWSPKQSPELRRLQLDKWADAFGVDYIREIDRQFSDASVHFIHKGVHQKYQLQGNDLEGYVGRLNTDLHIDIMGYAIRKLRDAGFVDAGAKLAVQIDDGLCVLRFPKGTGPARIVDAIRFIEKVYTWFSLEISWDKTYVSKHLRMFLNEIEYKDIRVTPGVKAFLRIRTERVPGIRCFLREINKAASQVGGAIESGTSPMVAWHKYAIEVGKCILDWNRHHHTKLSPDEAALWSFVPVAYGGAGCMAMLQHASNCTDNATSTGLSILKAIATYDNVARAPINAFLNQPIQTKSPLSTIRDPVSYHVEAPHLNDTVEISYAKRALRTRVKNPHVRDALELSLTVNESEIGHGLPPPSDTRGKALELMYAATPLAVLDKVVLQFSRSGTITQLIGFRNALRVYFGYRGQFRRVMANAISLLRLGSFSAYVG